MNRTRPAGDSRKKARAAAAGAGVSTGQGEAVAAAPASDLGLLQTLPVFLATAGQLTLDEQKLTVAQPPT